jgi:drug/metabolite transporter (DMT)-like permease
MKMKKKGNEIMFYVSALTAIVGAVGYQFFVKRVPVSLNPVVSVIGVYIAVLILSLFLLPLFPSEGGLVKQVRQLNWVQLAIAASVFFLELGFLLMYRYGWNLSTGNLITGVVINIALLGLGVLVLGEKMTFINAIGVIISIIGVALIGYRP